MEEEFLQEIERGQRFIATPFPYIRVDQTNYGQKFGMERVRHLPNLETGTENLSSTLFIPLSFSADFGEEAKEIWSMSSRIQHLQETEKTIYEEQEEIPNLIEMDE